MALNPQFEAFLQQMASAGVSSLRALGVEGYRGLIAQTPPLEEPEDVAGVRDLGVPGEAGDIPVRIYQPAADSRDKGVLVYFHGGGFMSCGLDTHDALCRALCNAADCVVVAVAYRLSPEVRFPGPLRDCLAVTRWVAANGAKVGGDVSRLAVGGDSAGGTFAAAAAVMARDAGIPVRHQLLMYPALDPGCQSASWNQLGEGYFITRDVMLWFWDLYLGSGTDPKQPQVSPAYEARLEGLAPATVITSDYDPLRDEGEAYAGRLSAAGVPTVSRCYPGMIHGFMNFGNIELVREARAEIGRDLRAALQR